MGWSVMIRLGRDLTGLDKGEVHGSGGAKTRRPDNRAEIRDKADKDNEDNADVQSNGRCHLPDCCPGVQLALPEPTSRRSC